MAANAERGFEGSVSALSVADVLQFQGTNHFSGSIVFSHQGQEAVVYLQHGDVVHAECGEERGEGVIGAILAWPTGNFETHANVATFARTIDKSLHHLLLDSARQLDERRQDGPRPPPLPAPAGAKPAPAPTAVVRARAVRGVRYAAVLRGGSAMNDASAEATALAARSALVLSLLAAPLGKALSLGDVSRAAITSHQGDQLLLLQSKDAYLALAVAPDASLGETEAAVRRALSSRPGA